MFPSHTVRDYPGVLADMLKEKSICTS